MRFTDDPCSQYRHESSTTTREWAASLDLGFARRDDATVLTRRQHMGPLRLLRSLHPDTDPGVCHAVIVHPPGGLVEGDRLSLTLHLDAGAEVLATAPGSQKWYRSQGGFAEVHARFRLGQDAGLEWLPPPAIVFDRARVDQTMQIRLDDGARFFGWECLVLGRRAMREAFVEGALRQRLELWRHDSLRWCDHWSVSADDPLFQSPLGLDGHSVVGTAWLAAPAAQIDRLLASIVPAELPSTLDDASLAPDGMHVLRSSMSHALRSERTRVGVSRVAADLLIFKLLADDSEDAMRALHAAWRCVRGPVMSRAAVMPRLWAT